MKETGELSIPSQDTPSLQRRREKILERLAKKFIPTPEFFAEDEAPFQNLLGGYIFAELLSRYEESHPLPEKGSVKEWYETFVRQKGLELQREVSMHIVMSELGIDPHVMDREILTDFCEEYPFPVKEESRKEWHSLFKEFCKQKRNI